MKTPSYSDRIHQALKDVPNDIAIKVLTDVNQRIRDWMVSGGDETDPYVQRQVRYAENVGRRCSVKQLN